MSTETNTTDQPTAAAKAPVAALDRDVVVRALEVRKVYRMGEIETHALRGVDLDIYRGEYMAIIGSRGSIGGYIAVDQARMPREHCLPIHAVFLDQPRAQRLNKNISLRAKEMQLFDSFGRLEIESDTPLVAVL
jgi:hypothetical protein